MTVLHVQVVVGVLRRHGKVVLVRERWGAGDRLVWKLPGGVVETGELLPEAAVREVSEETGLRPRPPGRVLYVVSYDTPSIPAVVVVAFEMREWTGDLAPSDPDGQVVDVRFFPVADALRELAALPSRVHREPATAYLRGAAATGAMWCYRCAGDPAAAPVRVIPA